MDIGFVLQTAPGRSPRPARRCATSSAVAAPPLWTTWQANRYPEKCSRQAPPFAASLRPCWCSEWNWRRYAVALGGSSSVSAATHVLSDARPADLNSRLTLRYRKAAARRNVCFSQARQTARGRFRHFDRL